MNGLMPYTTTATELQRNYKKVAKMANKIKEPVTVLSNNKPELVLMDYSIFRNVQEKRSQLKKKAGMKEWLDVVSGSWTKEEAKEFDKIIEEEFERIDDED